LSTPAFIAKQNFFLLHLKKENIVLVLVSTNLQLKIGKVISVLSEKI